MLRSLFALLLLLAAPAAAQSFRDANCSGAVDETDRSAIAADLFGGSAPGCGAADVNRDARLSAADLTAFALGPRVSFIGLASSDGRAAPPLGALPDGTPVYYFTAGFGFLLVVEVAAPPSGAAVGTTTFDSAANDPTRRPDFEIVADHALGDGSRDVCDDFGVPAVDPPDFALSQTVSDAINDLSCRFEVTTRRNAACTQNGLGQLDFVASGSRAQFCLAVNSDMAFVAGDTRFTVQVRDQSGLFGPPQQLVVRVGSGPPPGTFTPIPFTATPTTTDTPPPTATATATPTPSLTRTATRTRVPTGTATASARPTASPTSTRTNTAPASPTATRTPVASVTPTRAGTATSTRAVSSTPTRTPSRTATGGQTPPTSTRTRTPAATPTRTSPGAPTPTRTRSGTATLTQAPSATPTRTRTIGPTPTATAQLRGPLITFFGLTRADDVLIASSGTVGGVPLYEPSFGFGFSLVVEAKSGASSRPPGPSTYAPSGLPDLQIEVTQPLGNGSSDVCDDTPPFLGGVPAVNPPSFGDDPAIADSINDLACRFIDGTGVKVGRACNDAAACVLGTDGQFGCAAEDSTLQYCGFISQVLTFPSGDTLVTARVRDSAGNLGASQQLIVRVP